MRASWGAAKQEILSLQAELLVELASGKSKAEIYRLLHAKGKITVSERVFRRHLRELQTQSPVAEPVPGKASLFKKPAASAAPSTQPFRFSPVSDPDILKKGQS